jgi:hypothetical protein
VIPLGLKMLKLDLGSHFPSRQVIPLGLKMLRLDLGLIWFQPFSKATPTRVAIREIIAWPICV